MMVLILKLVIGIRDWLIHTFEISFVRPSAA